jgi:hypothetical protein
LTKDEARQELQEIKTLFTRIYEEHIEGETLMPILNMAYRRVTKLEEFLRSMETKDEQEK